MLKRFFFLILFTSFLSNAQDSLFVKLNPNTGFNQLSLYKVKGVQQAYVSNVKSDNNTFKFAFPLNSEPGIFRVFFDIQNKEFFEILYNNESISVEFDPEDPDKTAAFFVSKENKVYQTYIQTINPQQARIDSLQLVFFDAEEKGNIKKSYPQEVVKLNEIQHSYEELSVGLLAHSFIKSNRKFNSDSILETPEEYFNVIKTHFFDTVDFGNLDLNNSSIFIDKVIEYVFYLNDSDNPETYIATKQDAISEALLEIGENYAVKSEILSSLLYAFAGQEDVELVAFIKKEHYKKLPLAYQNSQFIVQIDGMIKTAIGSVAPEITWQNNGGTKRLSELEEIEYYIVAFWSTSCSHCLNEIPKLYEYTKNLRGLQVIAVALEDDAIEFDKTTLEMPNWIHVLGLNKWKNEFARSYDINSTPSYFVLDTHKKIIAKPEELENLIELFSEN